MMDKRLDRQDAWTIVGLLVISLISRIPFRSQILYHWDSVNFAYAMREFSVAKEQPQPPGYILYVGLCRLVDGVTHDAQTAMVSISIVASALAVVTLFCLGRSMFGRREGLIAALFLATSPLYWFYGEIALPHTLDALLVIVSVWFLYKVMQGDRRYLYPAIVVLAIAGGVRQQTLVFLAPLLLFALHRVKWQRLLIAGLLGAVICLAWFIPLIILSGGLANYMRVMNEFTDRFQSTTSIFMGAGWWGIRRNLSKLTLYTLYGWSAALLPAAIYVATLLRRREWPQRWEKLIFVLLWIMPAFIYYLAVHMGQQGLIFVFLPALLLSSTVGLTRLLANRHAGLIAAASVLIAVNAGIFGLMPEYPWGGDQRFLTRSTLVNSDRYYLDRFRVIKENLGPASTAILAANWHHVEYYLPAYKTIHIDIISRWEAGAGQPVAQSNNQTKQNAQDMGLTPDSSGVIRVIIFDDVLAPFNATPEQAKTIELDHGDRMQVLTLSSDQALFVGQTFGVGKR